VEPREEEEEEEEEEERRFLTGTISYRCHFHTQCAVILDKAIFLNLFPVPLSKQIMLSYSFKVRAGYVNVCCACCLIMLNMGPLTADA
jgi:hypothetical protein